mmetsp:Transcript_21521/g.43210  ORF Transcript_21521/g.43210 Transcript_21521/m.43210 type:complete len:214 (+) Transcript_21521:308-949(+)
MAPFAFTVSLYLSNFMFSSLLCLFDFRNASSSEATLAFHFELLCLALPTCSSKTRILLFNFSFSCLSCMSTFSNCLPRAACPSPTDLALRRAFSRKEMRMSNFSLQPLPLPSSSSRSSMRCLKPSTIIREPWSSLPSFLSLAFMVLSIATFDVRDSEIESCRFWFFSSKLSNLSVRLSRCSLDFDSSSLRDLRTASEESRRDFTVRSCSSRYA